jgi:hypothetical protein
MAGPNKRPERKKKHDPMLHPAASRESIECDIALAAFDRASREMDKAWGVDRLVELVSPDIAKRWGQAMADLNAAIISNDPPMVRARVDICLRGMKAMNAQAEAAGMPKADPIIWEYEYDGQVFGIIEDGRQWPAAYDKRPGLTIHTMREVAVALHSLGQTVADVKQAFPGAEVSEVRRKDDVVDIEDALPF